VKTIMRHLALAAIVGAAVWAAAGPAAKKAKQAQAGAKKAQLVIPNVPKDQQICFAMYTTQNNILKLTAQLYPLDPDDPREVRLEVKKDGQWQEIAKTRVRENEYKNYRNDRSWTAHFRVENWDMTQDVAYRVRHGESAVFEGLIRRNPVEKDRIVVAAFTGNSNGDRRLKPDIIANLKAQNPDLLFFSGDQSYDHTDHLFAWLLFGRQFGEIIKDRPTVAIPDDHDVGQGNVWGAGGKVASTPAGDDGGFFYPVEYVNEVQFAQTSNLPDPYDPTPMQRGINVFYTALNVGRVSFAILEDRYFKSGPNGLVPQHGPRPDHMNDPGVDPKTLDVPGAELLGARQEKFLKEWGQDWRGAEMKSVLSQTIFTGVPNIHSGQRLIADLDSNAWPQTPRNRAVDLMRRCFAFHISGDQHLASVVHYGIDTWNDAGWALCVPSIVNYYPRAFDPLGEPHKAIPTALAKTGEWRDGLGHPMTVMAYANPDPARKGKWGGEWGEKADGYGLVRFDLETRKITIECWPRGVEATGATAEQYPGWPVTVDQLDNYGREAAAWLPTLNVSGMQNPVVQVIDSGGEVVYTLRINGTSFRPKVFTPGAYTIKVGEPGTGRMKTLDRIESLAPDQSKTIEVSL
jgi:hypothetical protein